MLNKIKYSRLYNSEIIRGFASTTFLSGLSKLISVLITLYCSNYLSVSTFGEFGYLKNTLDIIIMISAANFTSLAIKFAAESMNSIISLKRLYLLIIFTFIVSVFCSSILLVVPSNLLNKYFDNITITFFMKFIGLFLPVFIIQPIVCAILRGYKKFVLVGIYEASLSFIFFVLVVITIHLDKKKGAIYALMLYHFLSSLVGIIILYYYNRKTKYLFCVNEFSSEYGSIVKMIIPVFFMSFIDAPIQWYGQTQVAKIGSYALVGTLTVITQVRYIIQLLPSFFYSSFTSFITILNSENKQSEYFLKFNKLRRILLIVGVVLMFFLIFTGKAILSLFNKEYVSYFDSYVISIITVPFLLFSALYKLNMMVKEHQVGMFYLSLFSSFLFFASLSLLIWTGINVLNAFFISQFVQYSVQYLVGYFFFRKDKFLALGSKC